MKDLGTEYLGAWRQACVRYWCLDRRNCVDLGEREQVVTNMVSFVMHDHDTDMKTA